MEIPSSHRNIIVSLVIWRNLLVGIGDQINKKPVTVITTSTASTYEEL